MSDDIKAILVEAFPDETGLIGEELLCELIRQDAPLKHLDLPGDDRFDLAPVYDFLRSAVGVATKLLREYDKWKEARRPISFKASIEIEIPADPAAKEAIVNVINRLADVIEARYKSRPSK